MRGRSTTITSNRTRSVSFSLALAALTSQPSGPTLESLPTEILLEIIYIAARDLPSSTKLLGRRLGLLGDDEKEEDINARKIRFDHRTLRSLALTSRALAGLAHSILYSVVSLSDSKRAASYARTVVDCAHRDITLSSPISPPSSFSVTDAGKYSTRLVLEYPFHDARGKSAEHMRFHASTGAILGVGASAPSAISPVLVSLRTLLVDTGILEHHLLHPLGPAHIYAPVSPTPTELVLRSYLRPTSPTPIPSPLAPLASNLTHLTISTLPQKWALPSSTLTALGDTPSLTHLALVRRANANEANDLEFVKDVEGIVSERAGTLKQVVLVVLPDSGFEIWRDDSEHAEASLAQQLESYLIGTFLWKRLASLTRSNSIPVPDIRSISPSPTADICVVPGRGDAWARALRNSAKTGVVFHSNIFLDSESHLEREGDLWRWARRYETGRRTREAAMMMNVDAF